MQSTCQLVNWGAIELCILVKCSVIQTVFCLLTVECYCMAAAWQTCMCGHARCTPAQHAGFGWTLTQGGDGRRVGRIWGSLSRRNDLHWGWVMWLDHVTLWCWPCDLIWPCDRVQLVMWPGRRDHVTWWNTLCSSCTSHWWNWNALSFL